MSKPKPASYYFIQFGFYGLVLFIAAGILLSFKVIFAVLFASVVLALVLEPLVDYLEMRGMNRVPVILGMYVVFAALVVCLAIFLIPLFVSEIKIFAANIPEYGRQIHNQFIQLQAVVRHRFPAISFPDYYSFITGKLFSSAQTLMGSVPAVASSVFSVLSMLLLVPLITFFLLADGHLITKSILRVVPNRYFEMCVLLIHKVLNALKLFVRGQLLDSCSIMITTMIGYAIIGLPYFVVIGILSGLANFIPYFGSIISVGLAVFILVVTPGAFTLLSLLSVAIVFVCIQIIDGTLVYPNVVGRQVNLHPLVVILGVTAGGSIAGIVGMLIAIPLISICKVTIEVLYTYLKSYSII
jgi:predicted PurR-regulated permease PerM